MSKISAAKGRKDGNSGYVRVIGNVKLGQLLSRVQATVISNGSELERMIADRSQVIEDLDLFIDDTTANKVPSGAYLCLKKTLKKSRYAQLVKKIEPDMLIFVVEQNRICKIIELKDGDAFDTKKSAAERKNLETFATVFGAKIPFVTDFFICSFNQESKEKIFEGFKGCFDLDHILTGSELCAILNIDYNEIKNIRTADAKENFSYFIDELLAIPEAKEQIERKLQGTDKQPNL
ncbi:hypothetical protein ACFBZI_11805 [Moraxella sp. ZJ142]|uniref:hypothetical protein n=1 Tax=Moraxella marmotae TaxID=3344520 RepID=UPI0035D4FA83